MEANGYEIRSKQGRGGILWYRIQFCGSGIFKLQGLRRQLRFRHLGRQVGNACPCRPTSKSAQNSLSLNIVDPKQSNTEYAKPKSLVTSRSFSSSPLSTEHEQYAPQHQGSSWASFQTLETDKAPSHSLGYVENRVCLSSFTPWGSRQYSCKPKAPQFLFSWLEILHSAALIPLT